MKIWIPLLALVLSSHALAASPVRFSRICTVEKALSNKPHVSKDVVAFTLAFDAHGKPASTLTPLESSTQHNGYFIYAPVETPLNALQEDVYVEGDKIRIHGDADGGYQIDLVLYKKGGYRAGYVRATEGDGTLGGNFYSKVSCD